MWTISYLNNVQVFSLIHKKLFKSLNKLRNLNFHPLEVVSRYRYPQLQVGENYSYLFNSRQRKILLFKDIFKF